MKKILIGTSALVAAAAFAGAANAADPIKLSIGGYGAVMVGYASQDDAYVRSTGNEVSAVDVKGDNEIHFSGKTTLDNGLTVAVKYEIESGGRSNADTVDEWSISLSGNFGTIKTGADDNALTMIHNNAPIVGGRLFNGGMAGGALLDGDYVLKPTAVVTATDTAIDTNSDAEAISYISPSFAGFTFGASYVPAVSQGEDNSTTYTAGATDAHSDAYGVGIGYNGKFGDVTVGADIGYLKADASRNITMATAAVANRTVAIDGRDEYQAGLKFGYAGFEIGGAYRNIQQDGGALSRDADGQVWEAGVSYKTGPYGVSLSYLNATQEQGGLNTAAKIADDEASVIQLSASYNMGPGVDLVGGLAHVSFDSEGAATAGADNDGWVAATGLSLSF